MSLINTYSLTIPNNQTEERLLYFAVNDPRYDRVEFRLYNETMPPDTVQGTDRLNASYRDLHLWVNVKPLPF
ncbi:MAG TPA: hypothetical protein VE134_06585, partial [Methanomicrobiales archaeon]|nr:hypothetical protein [Methanomicrobiales archaeon]